ncbi:hypothetical protein HYX06_06690 [Candidatus Woesearchaeota archaeon]|nr:hypothetical protein [Candidatus Woesearchaeota archaeon]
MVMYQGVDSSIITNLNGMALSRRTRGLSSGMESPRDMLQDRVARTAFTRIYGEPVYRLDHVRTALGIMQVGPEVGNIMAYLREHKVTVDTKKENESYARLSTVVEAMNASGRGDRLQHLETLLR